MKKKFVFLICSLILNSILLFPNYTSARLVREGIEYSKDIQFLLSKYVTSQQANRLIQSLEKFGLYPKKDAENKVKELIEVLETGGKKSKQIKGILVGIPEIVRLVNNVDQFKEALEYVEVSCLPWTAIGGVADFSKNSEEFLSNLKTSINWIEEFKIRKQVLWKKIPFVARRAMAEIASYELYGTTAKAMEARDYKEEHIKALGGKTLVQMYRLHKNKTMLNDDLRIETLVDKVGKKTGPLSKQDIKYKEDLKKNLKLYLEQLVPMENIWYDKIEEYSKIVTNALVRFYPGSLKKLEQEGILPSEAAEDIWNGKEFNQKAFASNLRSIIDTYYDNQLSDNDINILLGQVVSWQTFQNLMAKYHFSFSETLGVIKNYSDYEIFLDSARKKVDYLSKKEEFLGFPMYYIRYAAIRHPNDTEDWLNEFVTESRRLAEKNDVPIWLAQIAKREHKNPQSWIEKVKKISSELNVPYDEITPAIGHYEKIYEVIEDKRLEAHIDLIKSLRQEYERASLLDVVFVLDKFNFPKVIQGVENWLDKATREAEKLVKEYKDYNVSFQAAMDAYKFRTLHPFIPEGTLTEQGCEFIVRIAAEQFNMTYEEFLQSSHLHTEKIDYFNKSVIGIVNHLLYGEIGR